MNHINDPWTSDNSGANDDNDDDDDDDDDDDGENGWSGGSKDGLSSFFLLHVYATCPCKPARMVNIKVAFKF